MLSHLVTMSFCLQFIRISYINRSTYVWRYQPILWYLITVLYFCHVFTKELFYSVMLILRRENKLYFCDQLEVSCGQSSDLFLVALHLYIEAPVITIGHARNISWKHLQVWIIFFHPKFMVRSINLSIKFT